MFKKRIANNNKTETPKQSINLLDQIGNLQANNQPLQNPSQNQYQTSQKQQDTRPTQRNTISQKPQALDEDHEFLQRFQRDKKLQDLLNTLQNEQNSTPQEKDIKLLKDQYNHNDDDSFKPIIKANQPIKYVLPMQKKINLYSASSSNQNNHVVTNNEPQETQKHQQKMTQDKEIQNLFKDIIQQHKKEEGQAKKYNEIQNKQIQASKLSIKPNQFIIEDDDGYVQEIPQNQFVYKQSKNQPMLNVEIDYEGNLSPQLSQNDEADILKDNFHEQDFEDELIRKTLTRHNYLKLQQKSNLKHTKLSQKKDKLLNTILKTSWYEIDARLSSDINTKVTKRNELHQEMKYLEERIGQRSDEFDRKKVILKQLQHEQKRMKKVIYFICYFGDQLLAPGQTIESLFEDLTPNIITIIQKLSDKVDIDDFIEKKRSRDELREKYRSGRKKIKRNQGKQVEDQAIAQQQGDQDDDEDGQCYMEGDDF